MISLVLRSHVQSRANRPAPPVIAAAEPPHIPFGRRRMLSFGIVPALLALIGLSWMLR